MSFVSFDSLISSLTADKYFKYDWRSYTTSFTASPQVWSDKAAASLVGSLLISTRNTFAGTSLTWTPCDESTGNGTDRFGIPHGGNVSPDTKHVLNAGVHNYTASGGSSVSAELVLVDLQGYWPNINVNTTSTQNLTGTPGSNLRYANGAGCRLYLVNTIDIISSNTSGTSPVNITVSYTNQAGTTGRGLPFNVTVGPGNSYYRGNIITSGYPDSIGPFLPLANGDTGVANVASISCSALLGSGNVALCLARPLLSIPIVALNAFSEKDFVNYFPSLPRVVDGACLVWLQQGGAVNTGDPAFRNGGLIEFGWG